MTLADVPHAEGRAAIIARSVHGLEWVCACEVAGLTGTDGGLHLGRREVRFSVPAVSPDLLGVRTADDIFVERATVGGIGAAKDDLSALGRAAARLDWQSALRDVAAARPVPEQPSFDVVASIEGRRNYNRFAVERAVGAAVAEAGGWTFLERGPAGLAGTEPDITVRVFLRGLHATITTRLDATPLHRRAYKTSTGPGTLHPPVAAALALIAAPQTGQLLDPFCGDGTIAIEAALTRRGLRVMASDIDQRRVDNARRNARQAGVEIDLSVADAGTVVGSLTNIDAVITNPPWNLAVEASGRLRASSAGFWDSLPAVLSESGVLCSITDADLEIPRQIAHRRWTVTLEQQLRLAGRVAHLLLAAPPGARVRALSGELARWRRRALDDGIITDTGF